MPSTGVKGNRNSAHGTGHRKKKKKGAVAPSPYISRSGIGTAKGGGVEGALPLRILTLPRTLLDYVRATGHRP